MNDINQHSFSNLFERTVILGKALELRWFHNRLRTDPADQVSDSKSNPITRMPFLRRNLRYSELCSDIDDKLNHAKKKKPSRKMRNNRPQHDHGSATVDVLATLSPLSKVSGNKKLSMLIKPHRPFPPYIPYTNENQWIPPHPPCSALSLLKNKVQNSRNGSRISQSSLKRLWDELDDNGNFWKEEAKWDLRRYKHHKRLYNNARFRSEMGSVAFYYLHYNDFGRLTVQIEMREDRRCPFCWYDAAHDFGLLMHCKTVHGYDGRDSDDRGDDYDRDQFQDKQIPRITFEAGSDGNKNLHITVKSLISDYHPDKSKRTYFSKESSIESDAETESERRPQDFIFSRYTGSSHKCDNIQSVELRKQHTCLLDSRSRKRKIRQIEQTEQHSDFKEKEKQNLLVQYTADDKTPIRQYYHSKTMQPMAPGDWDVDSDDEANDSWAKSLSECALKELGDVSTKEKIFMNLWNRFMESHAVIKNMVIPEKCEEFLELCQCELFKHGLRNQYLLHLTTLWDNRLIPSDKILSLMMKFDKYEKEKK